MIKNVLYSLFLHFILITLIYFSFSFNPPIEIDKTTKVAISFVLEPKANSNNGGVALQPEQNQKNPVTVKSKTIPKKEVPLIKKVNPQHKKSKSQPKEIPKTIEKLEIKPKILANKAPEFKNDDVIKPEIKTPKPEEKGVDIKKELEETEITEIEDEIEDQEDENQYSFTENNIESLDLLVREKFNIQNQIKRCYQNALKEDGGNQAIINAHIFIAQDGFVDLDSIIFKKFVQHSHSQRRM